MRLFKLLRNPNIGLERRSRANELDFWNKEERTRKRLLPVSSLIRELGDHGGIRLGFGDINAVDGEVFSEENERN